MKIIVGGAGNVGRSITSYLSRANNDIIVVDINQERLDEIAKEFDVQTVLGSVSHPDVQEKIGANTADILISATDNDEVNLVACQVAYTLYNEKSLPVDLVISPAQEIAENILKIISTPGAKEVYDFASNMLELICLQCGNDCPLCQFQLSELYENFKDFKFTLIQIVRDGVNFYPKPNEHIKAGDEIYILTATEDVSKVLHAFNAAQKNTENVVIFGANAISYDIARHLEENDNIASIKIITNDIDDARKLSQNLNRSVVIYGEMMSDVILGDADFKRTDTVIAITSQDKDNLLISLLAQNNGVLNTISLVNSRMYDYLTSQISGNIIVDRSTVTISKILQDIRYANISNAYSLGRGFAEVWELRLKPDTLLEGKKIADITLPEKCRVLALVRSRQTIFDLKEATLCPDDVLIMVVSPNGIKKVESIFSV